MNVKSVEKENGNAKIAIEIEKAEFEVALNKAYAKCRKSSPDIRPGQNSLFALYFTKTDRNADKGEAGKYLVLFRCFRQNDRKFL